MSEIDIFDPYVATQMMQINNEQQLSEPGSFVGNNVVKFLIDFYRNNKQS